MLQQKYTTETTNLTKNLEHMEQNFNEANKAEAKFAEENKKLASENQILQQIDSKIQSEDKELKKKDQTLKAQND